MKILAMNETYLGMIAATPVYRAIDSVIENDHGLEVKINEPKNGIHNDFFASIKLAVTEGVTKYIKNNNVDQDIAVQFIKEKVNFVFPSENCCGYKSFKELNMQNVVGYEFTQQ